MNRVYPMSDRALRLFRMELYLPQFSVSDHDRIERAYNDRDQMKLGRVMMETLDKVFQRRTSNERPHGVERRSDTRNERRRTKR